MSILAVLRKMGLIPGRRAGIRDAIGVAACAYALVGVFSMTGHAGQSRTVSAGVYSREQANRGQQLYQAQCVTCHGNALQGVVGPMLAGDWFLMAWAGRPMSDLVDKIQNTMPQQAPRSLTREQSTDIAAYILQAGKFPAGSSELAAVSLSQVTFPEARTAPASALAGSLALAPTASLAQLMRGVTFPNANIIFNTQGKDPGQEKPKTPVPFDYALWGQTVYYGWQAVDQAALALQETTPLFLLPGRRCENGRPAPVNKADYQQYAHELIDLAKDLYKASQSRDVDKVAGMSDKLTEACANCHKAYRDVGTSEGGGLGTDRCRQ
jgi:S-disulfanyl-L-cysteine oxidoreductase SoxD